MMAHIMGMQTIAARVQMVTQFVFLLLQLGRGILFQNIAYRFVFRLTSLYSRTP
jgi:hypothetical protein